MIEQFIQKLEGDRAISFEVSPARSASLDPVIEK